MGEEGYIKRLERAARRKCPNEEGQGYGVSRQAYSLYKRQGSRDLKDRSEGGSKEFSLDHPKASGIEMERPSLHLYDGRERDKV